MNTSYISRVLGQSLYTKHMRLHIQMEVGKGKGDLPFIKSDPLYGFDSLLGCCWCIEELIFVH